MGLETLVILRAFISWAAGGPEVVLSDRYNRAPTEFEAIFFRLGDFVLHIFQFFHMEHHAKYHKQFYDISYVYRSNAFDYVGLDVFTNSFRNSFLKFQTSKLKTTQFSTQHFKFNIDHSHLHKFNSVKYNSCSRATLLQEEREIYIEATIR